MRTEHDIRTHVSFITAHIFASIKGKESETKIYIKKKNVSAGVMFSTVYADIELR